MLSGFQFDKEGKASELSAEAIRALPHRPKDLIWIDVQGTDAKDLEILSKNFQFHQLAIDDCLSPMHHPKIDEFEDHLFLIFRSVDCDVEKHRLRTAKLACFLGENFLVTFHRQKMNSVEAIRSRCQKDQRFGQRGPDFILHGILDVMVDLYFPEIEEIEKAAEALQDEVLTKARKETLQEILNLKRDVLHLRRFANPQREVLNRLSRPDYRYIRQANAIYFRDIFDHTFRISDAIDNQREMLTSLMESYLSMVSNRLNEVMKVLTMITTIMMPLTFIAGIYGMNFQVMPELEWVYGYPFALLLMLVTALGMYWWFRRKQWF